jgi:redox-sensitive bicupin YhaK (pirin superfamily)
MDKTRKIQKVIKGRPVLEGARVRLKRLFGFNKGPEFDPFLLLDDFRAEDPRDYLKGFPWHPHRGIETITYILEGKVEHAGRAADRLRRVRKRRLHQAPEDLILKESA